MLLSLIVKNNFKTELTFKVIGLVFSLLSLILVIGYGLLNGFLLEKFSILNTFSSVPQLSGIKAFAFFNNLDSLSYTMVLLTSFCFPVAFLSCFNSVKNQIKKYIMLMLLLQGLCMAFFCASSLLSFYVFFEAGLVPMFLMIGIWGGENKNYAALKFFIYTFAGSVFLLGAIIFLYIKFDSFDMQYLISQISLMDVNFQSILWICFAISLLIKLPSFPFHTWLPDAHVQAPTSASVILAAVLIKMGGYGFLRFVLPAMPLASLHFQHFMISLGIISVIYGSFVAIKQQDIKKMIAYSSVAHMGYVTIGIFSLNDIGINAAIFQMVSHGVVSGGLFLCVGVLYERLHTKKFAEFGGIASVMPNFALYLMILTMSSVGLPTTSGFVGEFSAILAVFKISPFYSIFAAFGIIFGCVYMLHLYKNTMFGKITNSQINYLTDLNLVEKINLSVLCIATICLGLCPNIIYGIL